MTVGASGSNSVCVYTYHQNVKLMLTVVNPGLDYKHVLSFYVCDIYNKIVCCITVMIAQVKLMLNFF